MIRCGVGFLNGGLGGDVNWVIESRRNWRLGHNFIGSEHVLCALVGLPDLRLCQLFAQRDADVQRVRDGVISIATLGPNHDSHQIRPWTPRLQRIIPIAEAEADRFKHLTLPQSLLLGIVIEGQGVAVRVLESLRFDLVQLKESLLTP